MKEYEKSKRVVTDLNFYSLTVLFSVGVACVLTGKEAPRWIDGAMFSILTAFLMVRLIIMVLESRHGADK